MMKESRYNTIINYEGHEGMSIAYNALTTALAIVETDKVNQIPDILHEKFDGIDPDFIEDLKKGGFIVPADFDEYRYIKYRSFQTRFNTNQLSLTIAPTLACNFRCIYCYQGDDHPVTYMSEETQDKIIDYIEKANIQALGITWYGGEPLLALEIIERMYPKIKDIVERKKLGFYSDTVTNGYLLNEEICHKLNDFNVRFMQITLDGPEEIHNSRRFLAGGQGTYRKILQNLVVASEHFKGEINIRINVDRSNAKYIHQVADDLNELGLLNKMGIHLGYTDNDAESALKNYNADEVMYYPEFVDIQHDFLAYMYELTGNHIYSAKHRYPDTRPNRCVADTLTGYVVGPEGDLYKCWNHIGRKERCVGNITSDVEFTPTLFDCVLCETQFHQPCSNCKLLPICMGGCVDRSLNPEDLTCIPVKYYFKRYLHEVAAEVLAAREKQTVSA